MTSATPLSVDERLQQLMEYTKFHIGMYVSFVTLNADRSVAIVDLTTRAIVRKIAVGASPDGVGFGPSF